MNRFSTVSAEIEEDPVLCMLSFNYRKTVVLFVRVLEPRTAPVAFEPPPVKLVSSVQGPELDVLPQSLIGGSPYLCPDTLNCLTG